VARVKPDETATHDATVIDEVTSIHDETGRGDDTGPRDDTGPGDDTATREEVLLTATGLTKRFGDFTAVDGIDFAVRKGECFGFLGPNGAGKSSTMRMVG
jgi:ABC-type glutathione transport system ATPase component